PSGASPSWSARPATTRSTLNGHQPQAQPRHKSLESRMPGKLARPVRRGAVRKRTRELREPRRTAYPTVERFRGNVAAVTAGATAIWNMHFGAGERFRGSGL